MTTKYGNTRRTVAGKCSIESVSSTKDAELQETEETKNARYPAPFNPCSPSPPASLTVTFSPPQTCQLFLAAGEVLLQCSCQRHQLWPLPHDRAMPCTGRPFVLWGVVILHLLEFHRGCLHRRPQLLLGILNAFSDGNGFRGQFCDLAGQGKPSGGCALLQVDDGKAQFTDALAEGVEVALHGVDLREPCSVRL